MMAFLLNLFAGFQTSRDQLRNRNPPTSGRTHAWIQSSGAKSTELIKTSIKKKTLIDETEIYPMTMTIIIFFNPPGLALEQNITWNATETRTWCGWKWALYRADGRMCKLVLSRATTATNCDPKCRRNVHVFSFHRRLASLRLVPRFLPTQLPVSFYFFVCPFFYFVSLSEVFFFFFFFFFFSLALADRGNLSTHSFPFLFLLQPVD